tara:strand:+ start:5046 stop:5774 length:729 start_codon:yes stop_codon:yes gene_type:complete
MAEEDNEFGNVFEEPESELDGPEVPRYGSQEWSEFVLSQLTTEEKDGDGRPKCDGLRRVAHQLFDVVASRPVNLTTIEQDGKVTDTVVQWEFEFLPRKSYTFHEGVKIPTIKIGAVASANELNVNRPFNKFLPAMADTRAESRAYKKGLLLNCVTSEEMPEPEEEEVGAVTQPQIKMASIMMTKCGIDREKFLKLHRKDISKAKGPKLLMENFTKAEMTKANTILSKYQANNTLEIPEEIKL